MFVSRSLFRAAPGQAPALRELLLGIAQSDTAVIVAQRLWGEVPLFTVLRGFDSLDALDQWRTTWQPNPEVGRQFPTLLAAAAPTELWELPGAAPAGSASRYSVRWTFNPALGKFPDLQQAIQGRVEAGRAAGRRVSLWRRVSGGPFSVVTVTGFDSLGDIEKVRAAALADPAVQEANRALAPLLAAPVDTPDCFEILAQPA